MRAATFTTYHTVQLDPNIEAAFDRQARAATNSYGTISRAAAAATQATAGLLGGRGTAGLGAGGSAALRERTTAIQGTGRAAVQAAQQATTLATATRRESLETTLATRSNERFATSLKTTATALAVVQGPLGPLAGKLRAASVAMTELTGARLGLAGAGAALFGLGREANEFVNLTTQLRPFFDTQTQVNHALDDIVGIATRARSSLEPVAALYVRLTDAGKALGISQRDAGRYTEIITKAATLSGGSKEVQHAGITQLTQALGAGVLQGQDLRAVKDDTYALAKAIADGFKNANGTIGTTIGSLKTLAESGQLTARAVLDALGRSAGDIEKKFARLPKTLQSSTIEFSNALLLTVGRFDESVGFTHVLAESLSLVANNLRVILSLAAGVATAFATTKAFDIGGGFVGTVSARFRALQQERELMRGNALLDRGFALEAVQNEEMRARATAASVVSLRAEAVALEENVLALRAQAAAAGELSAQAAASQFGRVAAEGAGPVGIGLEEARVRAAVATKALAEAEARLAQVHAGLIAEEALLTTQTAGLVVAQEGLAVAEEATVVSTGTLATGLAFLRAGAGSLITLLGGPMMIAFAAVTAAIYLWVTAESAAEAATRKNEAAQKDFERTIDRTTGKIYAQIGALELQAKAREQHDASDAAHAQFNTSLDDLVRRAKDFSRPVDRTRFELARGTAAQSGGLYSVDPEDFRRGPRTPAEQELDRAIQAVEQRKPGAFNALQATIQKLSGSIDGLKAAVPQLGTLAGHAREQFTTAQTADARLRVISGQPRPNDLAIALGAPPAAVATRKKKELLDREAAAAAEAEAKNPRIAAEGRKNQALLDLENRRTTTTMSDAEYLDQRKAIVATYHSEIQGIQERAKADAEAKRQAKKEARDAIQDQKDLAAEERDRALLDLQRRKPTLTQDQYLAEQIAIKRTYDEKMARIDSSARASHSAMEAEIRDLEKVQEKAQRQGERRRDILDQYSEAPKAQVKAADQIDDLQRFVNTAVDGVAFIGKTKDQIEAIAKINPLGTGIYTQAMLEADSRRIQQGIRKPLDDIFKEHERAVNIASLTLQGRDREAAALKEAYTQIDRIGHLDEADYQRLVRNAAQQEHINSLLESRQRITSLIIGSVDEARDSFEKFLVELPNNAGKAAGNLFTSFSQRFAQINARMLTERIFAGADEKVKALVSGRSAVETATGQFVSTMNTTVSATQMLADANRQAAADIAASAHEMRASVHQAAAEIANVRAVPDAPAALMSGLASSGGARIPSSFYKPGVKVGGGIGDDVIYAALGPLAKITENIRSAATQTALLAKGLTTVPASRDAHVQTENAWDVRLPKGMSFAEADRLIKQTAAQMGARVLKSYDETKSGGTGPHGHWVIVGPDGSQMALEPSGAAGAKSGSFVEAAPQLSARMHSLEETVASLDQTMQNAAAGGGYTTGANIPGHQQGDYYVQGDFAAITPDPLAKPAGAAPLPSPKSVYNQLGSALGTNIDLLVDKLRGRSHLADGSVVDKAGGLVTGSTFFKKMGDSFGTALQGAGTGAIASGFAKALGIKQSNVGAQIGGAIGGIAASAIGLPPIVGQIVGGLLGGTVGAMFSKPKAGAATLSVNQYGQFEAGKATGNDAASRSNASGLATTVGDSLQNIADQLFGKVTGSGSVSLGYRSSDKNQPFRVDPSGAGRSTGNGVLAFASQEEAIQKAVQIMLQEGVIQGISAASQKILQSGQDLQKALTKAVAIESVPRQLMQLTDPVRYAVTTLNEQFDRLISYMKEGGATAQQFADAQKLYDLQRAQAVSQATSQAAGAIDQFLKDMVASTSSPLNKLDTYQNAAKDLEAFKADIAAGKTVDQNTLLSAARNFQDASRSLNGSSSSFFDDFNMLRDLLTKARDNAGITDVTTLPASPFASDATVQSAIASLQAANSNDTQAQTDALIAKLDQVVGAIQGNQGGGGGYSYGDGRAIDSLPGSNGGGGFGRFGEVSVVNS